MYKKLQFPHNRMVVANKNIAQSYWKTKLQMMLCHFCPKTNLSQKPLVPNCVARQREKRSKQITLRIPILPSRWVLSFRLHSSLTYAHTTLSPLLSLHSHHKELVQPEQRDRVLLILQNCCVLAKLEKISTSELKLMFCCIL